jgi:hypothetical protein
MIGYGLGLSAEAIQLSFRASDPGLRVKNADVRSRRVASNAKLASSKKRNRKKSATLNNLMVSSSAAYGVSRSERIARAEQKSAIPLDAGWRSQLTERKGVQRYTVASGIARNACSA